MEHFEGFTKDDVLLCGALASREENQDPIDTAVITKARSEEALSGRLDTFKIGEFKPFDPVVKHTEAAVEAADGAFFRVAKGGRLR